METELPKQDVGILLIHGIGEQARGQTLAAFGEPICQWIERWLNEAVRMWLPLGIVDTDLVHWWDDQAEKPLAPGMLISTDPELEMVASLHVGSQYVSDANVKRMQLLKPLLDALPKEGKRHRQAGEDVANIEEMGARAGLDVLGARVVYIGTSLTVTPNDGGAPLNTTLNMEVLRTNGDVVRSSWLLAECHWAQSFSPPDFNRLAGWLMYVAPWTVVSYVMGRIRCCLLREAARATPIVVAHVSALVMLSPLTILLGLAIQLLIAVLWLLRLIPVPFIRAAVARASLSVADVLGDSFAFASNVVQQAAILDQVARDTGWLASKCKHLVIVAHSQGAAVTWLSLLRGIPRSLKLLVTFGSGLSKLEEFYRSRQPGERTVLVTFTLSLVTSYMMGYWSWLALHHAGIWTLVYYGIALFVSVAMTLGFASEEEGNFFEFASVLKNHGVKWLDCAASADPVCNGTLDTATASLENVESLEVHNQASFWADHTTYMANRDEFLGVVLTEIARQCASPVPLHQLTPYDEASVRFARRRRAWRVACLKAAQLGWGAVGAALLWVHHTRFGAVGASVNDTLRSRTRAWAWMWDGTDGVTILLNHPLLGGASILLAVLVGQVLLYWAWLLWDRQDTWHFFKRSEFPQFRIDSALDIVLLLGNYFWEFQFFNLNALFAGAALWFTVPWVSSFFPFTLLYIGLCGIFSLILTWAPTEAFHSEAAASQEGEHQRPSRDTTGL